MARLRSQRPGDRSRITLRVGHTQDLVWNNNPSARSLYTVVMIRRLALHFIAWPCIMIHARSRSNVTSNCLKAHAHRKTGYPRFSLHDNVSGPWATYGQHRQRIPAQYKCHPAQYKCTTANQATGQPTKRPAFLKRDRSW